jgi:hypothetical protein
MRISAIALIKDSSDDELLQAREVIKRRMADSALSYQSGVSESTAKEYLQAIDEELKERAWLALGGG